MIARTLTAAVVAATAIATPATAFDISAMSDAERNAFRAEVRAYLLENPEVLLEAINVLEERQAAGKAADDAALIAANADALFDDGWSWVGGNPEGDVTVVEFLDYRCGYCKRAFPDVKELLQSDGNIRFIVKEFPILGEQSVLASRFAIATKNVAGDAAYGQVHDALMAFRGEISEDSLKALAAHLGLDADAIFAEMSNPEIERIIAENRRLAQRLQINGTPSFVFGDQMLRGYAPLEHMRALVEELRGEG
jgi:protein-disulfide isomerase